MATSPCPLCASSTEWHLRKNGHDLARCNVCGFQFVDPTPSDAELAAQYDDKSFFDYTSIARREGGADFADIPKALEAMPAAQIMACDEILDVAADQLGRRGSLLDVGCGNGPLLLVARDRGWEPHGLETSRWAVRYDREALGLDVCRGVLEDHPFASGSFDVITLIHSLEHMPRPMASLEAARDLLAAGGVLHVQVPNLASLGRRFTGRHWQAYVPPSHLWYFDRHTLARMLAKTGFEVTFGECRILSPRNWRDRPVQEGDTMRSAAQTGMIDSRSPKQLLKRIVRTPLQKLWLLDSLNVWARPK